MEIDRASLSVLRDALIEERYGDAMATISRLAEVWSGRRAPTMLELCMRVRDEIRLDTSMQCGIQINAPGDAAHELAEMIVRGIGVPLDQYPDFSVGPDIVVHADHARRRRF